MDANYVLEIASTIKTQLFTMDKNLMWGLGSNKFVARTNDKGQPTLTFTVKGIKHKGQVDISLDEGMDLYNVKVYTARRKTTKVGEYVPRLSLCSRPSRSLRASILRTFPTFWRCTATKVEMEGAR